MPLLKRAGLAMLLACLPMAADAATAHWASDPASGCALYDANLRPGDTVSWSGACRDGRAEGPGTATFFKDGAAFEHFTGSFAGGVAADGAVTVNWGDGWSYDGEMANGRFDGEGILVSASHDRFEGLWNGGKLDGMGSVIHDNGERYDGGWKNDLPNGHGILTRADGSKVEGQFQDGKFTAGAAPPLAVPVSLNSKAAGAPVPAPVAAKDSAGKEASGFSFADLAGKKLLAVDGAMLNLTVTEGGIARQISGAGGSVERTTFTFINERLGTVAEDAGASSASAANVTGFFRLTGNGVEVRYADGRGETLATNDDGGVLLRLETPGAPAACRNFYPADHSFSAADKKAAVAEYASRLGLGDTRSNCPGDAATAAPLPPAAEPAAQAQRRGVIRHPAKFRTPGSTTLPRIMALAPVTVRDSVVHGVDDAAAMPMAEASAAPAMASPPGDRQ